MKRFLLPSVIFIILMVIFLLHYFIVKQAVYGDGIFYWSYTRSLWKDRNLDLRNEINHNFSPLDNNRLEKENYQGKPVQSWFPIGVSLAWLPVFAVVDGAADIIHHFNSSFPNNGYSDIYQISLGIYNIVFIVIGIYLSYLFLKNFFSERICLIAVVTWLFASNLLFYGAVDVLNSHPLSYLLSVFFIYFWYKTYDKRSIGQWLILGTLLGAMSVVRTQELLFGIFLIGDVLRLYRQGMKIIFPFVETVAVILIIYSLQSVAWINLQNPLTVNPYMKSGFAFNPSNLISVMWSEKNGLWRWTPVYIFGLLGLLAMLRRLGDKKNLVGLYLFTFCCLQILMVGSWQGMVVGGSYGMRLLLSSSLPYAFGLAAMFQTWMKLVDERWLRVFSVLIVILNLSNIVYFLLFVQ